MESSNVNTTYIYGLCDPRDGRVRYVGKADNPQARMKGHFNDKRNCHRVHWIQSLVEKGLKPALVIIQKVAKEEWQEWERYWISLYAEAGYELTNGTGGGDGVDSNVGRKRTPEHTAKMSAANMGNKYALGTRILRNNGLKDLLL